MDRVERVGKNEALFREVNDRIRDISIADEEAEFLCECGDDSCTTPIRMSLAEYEGVRSDPRHFALVPGHEAPDVERVIERNERFQVIEKRAGEPTRIAVETDPRR